jgi:elongator complex protein 3
MIRELHVYGRVREVGLTANGKPTAQHLGLGKKLLVVAEQLAERAGYEKMAIISGIGVRDYYRQRGYDLHGSYMMKELSGGTGYYQFIVRMLAIVFFAYFVALLTRTIRF